ncbi:MAG: hypothetical protein K6B45_05975 [Bacteroidaceae bacterium]|nr:hypothetical protein [Bacteroidaceae bacterium]
MKTYIQPSIEIQEIQVQQMVAASIGLDNTNKYTGDGKNFAPPFRNPFALPGFGGGFGGGFGNPFEE